MPNRAFGILMSFSGKNAVFEPGQGRFGILIFIIAGSTRAAQETLFPEGLPATTSLVPLREIPVVHEFEVHHSDRSANDRCRFPEQTALPRLLALEQNKTGLVKDQPG